MFINTDMNLKKLPVKDIRLIRDWKQFSYECHSCDWVEVDEEYIPEFKEFLKKRTDVLELSDVVEYVGEAELRMYFDDLPSLRGLLSRRRRD